MNSVDSKTRSHFLFRISSILCIKKRILKCNITFLKIVDSILFLVQWIPKWLFEINSDLKSTQLFQKVTFFFQFL